MARGTGSTGGTPPATDIEVDGPMIRLGQLLKLAGLVDSGGDVRAALATDEARVNGIAEARRGRQLHQGDVVDFAGARVRVATRPHSAAG